MVVIRLSRVGKKNSPAYRVVVAENRRAVKRKFIEVIGHYNPTQTPKELKIDAERASFWMEKGAQPSDTVRNLMADIGILKKDEKVNIKYAKDKKKKELKAEKENEDSKPQIKNSQPKADESLADAVKEKVESNIGAKDDPIDEKKAKAPAEPARSASSVADAGKDKKKEKSSDTPKKEIKVGVPTESVGKNKKE